MSEDELAKMRKEMEANIRAQIMQVRFLPMMFLGCRSAIAIAECRHAASTISYDGANTAVDRKQLTTLMIVLELFFFPPFSLQNEKASARMDEDSYAAQLAKVKAEFEAKNSNAAENATKSLNAHRLANINEDPALNGLVTHLLDEGETTLGRKAKSNPFDPRIKLAGLSINDKHCVLILSGGKVTLQIPDDVPPEESKTCVNGKPVAKVLLA